MNEEKEVYFDQYCKSCKYHGLEESKDPCNDCLAEPSNTNSHKPMNYESKKQFLMPRKRMRLILQRNFAIAKKSRKKLHRQNLFTKLVASLNKHGSIKSDISERRNHANIYWRTAEWKDYYAHRNV